MKKFKFVSLLSLTLLLAGCGETTNSSVQASSTEATSSVAEVSSVESSVEDSTSYPAVTISARALADEVEIGQSVEVRAIVAGTKCTFTSSDPSIATVVTQDNGVRADVTGVAPGKVTITVVPLINPTVSASVTINVIASKPTLRDALKTVQSLDNYTINVTNITDKKTIGNMLVTENAIIYNDLYGDSVMTDKNSNRLHGEMVTSDGKVVYVKKENGAFVTTGAELVQTNVGLLTADNFKGTKGAAKQAFEVGELYSFDAINPNWVTDVKTEKNKYVIDGEALDDEKNPTNINGAFVESLLWKIVDPTGYASAVASLGEDYYWSLAEKIDTTITVEASNAISVTVDVLDTQKTYTMTMEDINQTTLENEDNDIETVFANATAADPVVGDKLAAGIAAVKTDNYVRVNSMFPDHETEIQYTTYYTPNYVFHDCNAEFANEYNTHLGSDTEAWTDIPYGYVKKADGVYKFTYDEATLTVSVADTKEAGTDANTTVPEYDKYFSTLSTFDDASTLKYAFAAEEEAIWNGRSTKYYTTTSRTIFDEFINYYAPEDIEEIIENTKAGFGVVMSGDKVTAVNGTVGFTPFSGKDNDITKHRYGVDYFVLNNFGAATTNHVDTLLQTYINK